MEPLWSPVVATRGNQRQIERPPKTAQIRATVCHRLPETFHGKEGVAAVNELRGQPRLESVAILETDTGPFLRAFVGRASRTRTGDLLGVR